MYPNFEENDQISDLEKRMIFTMKNFAPINKCKQSDGKNTNFPKFTVKKLLKALSSSENLQLFEKSEVALLRKHMKFLS